MRGESKRAPLAQRYKRRLDQITPNPIIAVRGVESERQWRAAASSAPAFQLGNEEDVNQIFIRFKDFLKFFPRKMLVAYQ
jgi:hypothetical protein